MGKRSKRFGSEKKASSTTNGPVRGARTKPDERTLFWVSAAVVIVIALLAYIHIFDKKLDLGGDNAAYYLLGKGLSSGEGYTNTWMPDKPPANHFPPGYPAILGLVMLATRDIVAIKVVNGVFFFAALFLLMILLRHLDLPPLFIAVACAITAVNAHLLRYATIMMSEIPFLFFSILALIIAARMRTEKKAYQDPLMLGLVLCLAVCYYIRTIGIAVVFGIVVYLALRKAWLHIGTTAGGFLLLVLPWFLRGQALGGNAYLHQLLRKNPYRPELGMMGLADVFTRFFKNAARHVSTEIPNGCFPFLEKTVRGAPVWGWILGLLLVALVIAGIVHLRKFRVLIAGYLVGTFGITLLWPDVWYGVRFIVAVVPLLIALSLWGLYALLDRIFLRRSERRLSPFFFAILLLPSLPPLGRLHADARRPYPPNWNNYFMTANWAHRNTATGEVVCCRKPELFSLFSDRQTVRYAFSTDADVVIERMDSGGVDYVVIDQLGFSSTPRYLVPAVRAHADRFETVLHLKDPDTILLRMRPESLSGEPKE